MENKYQKHALSDQESWRRYWRAFTDRLITARMKSIQQISNATSNDNQSSIFCGKGPNLTIHFACWRHQIPWQGCFKTHLNLRGEHNSLSICGRHVRKFLRLIDVFWPVFARVSPFWSHKSLTKLQERLTWKSHSKKDLSSGVDNSIEVKKSFYSLLARLFSYLKLEKSKET